MSTARPRPGQEAYDTATGRVGVLQAVCDVKELIFDHRMPGPRVAFLRPVRGGQEWTTDFQNVTFPEGARPRSEADDEYGTPSWTEKGTPS
ncbi:hypothetical protein ABVG11_21250 [Streptomyces sp. HD1123-B1]|uniref:hypothetical protein n=1 Tax=Streptomyces huangiella TaxID=3228804 RepID=UPI003D7DA4FD